MRTKRMRALNSKRISFVAGILVAAIAANRVAAQAKPPTLKATADLRVDSALANPARNALIIPGPSGEMIVSPEAQGAIRWFDASGRALPFKAVVGFAKDPDIRMVSRLAWAGSTLIAVDPGFRQIALLDKTGKVTKSIEMPSMIRPSWSDRHKYPLFSRYETFAVYPNGEWLVRAAEAKTFMSTPDYDSSYTYFMRTNENGSIQRSLARVPKNDGLIDRRSGPSRFVYRTPFAARTLWDVSPDGARIVVVSQAVRGADSASYRVTVIGEKGDTVVSKKYSATLVPVTKKSIDSALARVRGGGSFTVEGLRATVAKEIPPVFPPVENLIAGSDNTIWLELHSTGADRQWLAIDPTGTPIGVANVARTFVARAGDKSHLWGFETEGEQLRTLVRYTMSAAPAATKR
jgi:hypothetical protein